MLIIFDKFIVVDFTIITGEQLVGEGSLLVVEELLHYFLGE
jgi:hypothetical protein